MGSGAAVSVAADLAAVTAEGAGIRRPIVAIQTGIAEMAGTFRIDRIGLVGRAGNRAGRRLKGIGRPWKSAAGRIASVRFADEPGGAECAAERPLDGITPGCGEGSGKAVELRFVHGMPSIPEPVFQS